MTSFRGAQDLGELAEALRGALAGRGRPVRAHAVRRGKGQAPTMGEWVAGQGLDAAWLTPGQQESFGSAFRRCMERALGDAFWDSNHTRMYGLPSRPPTPELGVDSEPIQSGNVLGRLRTSPPRSFVELAGLLKGAAASSNRAPTDRLYRAASHKKKTGRRSALRSPSFEQWAITCGVPITRLTRHVVAAAEKVYVDLLDAYLEPWFGDRRAIHEHEAPRGAREGGGGGAKPGPAAATGRAAKAHESLLQDWLRARFADFDEDYMGRFTALFPAADAARVIDLAALWDTKQPDGRYSNFKRFLRRSAAVLAAMKAGGLSLPAANDWVFNELNAAYDAIAALVAEKGRGTLDPLEFAAEVEAMPMLLKTSPADLKRILEDVKARNVGSDLDMRETLQQVARRVQMGRGAGVQGDPLHEIVRRAVGDAGAQAAEHALGVRGGGGGDAYSKPGTHHGGGTDTLHALRHKHFGQQSTKDMVARAIRMGSEPWTPQGTTWVVPDGHGGGAAANAVTNMDGLVRDVVNQLVHQQEVAPQPRQQRYYDRPRAPPPRPTYRSFA